MKLRWKPWAAGAAALLALLAAYTVAGFWLLPVLIRHEVPRFARSELARQASVGEVRFNPYTLRLQAQDLRLAEADGAPLFAIGQLAVELRWRSLIDRTWSFVEIRVAQPSVNLVITPDGKFNLAELLARLRRRDPSAAGNGLPRLLIDRLTLEQGTLDLHDRRVGYANHFSSVEFALAHFSTLPEHNDAHTLSAESASGGKLRWKGTASVNPLRATGELSLEGASLPELAVYLKAYTRARVASGQLSATLPYSFSYADGKVQASLAGARLQLRNLALAREGAGDSFAALTRLDVSDIDADLVRREATVGSMRADGGQLHVRRDARGELDLAHLMVETAGPAAARGPRAAVVLNTWKLAVRQLVLDQVAVTAMDETASPPLQLSADKAQLQLRLTVAQAGADTQVTVENATCTLADLVFSSGTRTPLKLARLAFSEGRVDLAARHASVGRLWAEGGQLQLRRDRAGKFDVLGMLPGSGAATHDAGAAASSAGRPWTAFARSVELSRFGAQVLDQDTGLQVHVADLGVKLEEAGNARREPVRFHAGLTLREGGQLTAQGHVVPASGVWEAQVSVRQLALAPFQPILARYLKLKFGGGSISGAGRLSADASGAKGPVVRYVGGLDIAGLVLNEQDGGLFASWKRVSAGQLVASLGPNLLDIPDLRIVEPNATLIIENDRSFNAARLLVRRPSQAAAAQEPFPVRVRRLRVQNGKLAFTDLSLRPQFSARIYALNGVVNGLSSSRQARSRIELDGRVDEFGVARIRGELNPFAPRNNTNVNLVFRNVDMVPASPYTMKFAGYRIAAGKLSVDLQYQVRQSQLEGTSQIVIDKLTLGERVESPDALKLPLQLAIAILKDSDGRINLGLPVSGNLNDPQFSYAALIWKAIGSVVNRIVAAPFRALANLLGLRTEKLEAVDFDPGSATLSPPEREKLKHVAQLLAQRGQLRLSVPGQYSESADGAALRASAVRAEIGRRAGIKLQPGEEPGPLDLGDRSVRGALRALYAERFGDAELDQQKKAAEAADSAAAGSGGKTEAAPSGLPLWQRVGRMIQGEPRVADAGPFYERLQQRLEQSQPVATDALARLGTQRAAAVVAALQEAGVDSARALASAPENIASDPGKPVPLKLGLTTR